MYKSPLEIISSFTNDTAYKIKTETDNLIMEAVYNVVVNVDKAELIKALEYDRDQYEKGYRDGKEDATTRAPVFRKYYALDLGRYIRKSEISNVNSMIKVIPFCGNCEAQLLTPRQKYCHNCGAKMDEEGGADND